MGTNFDIIYDAFLRKMSEDDWVSWTEEEIKEDLSGILKAAIVWIKIPKISLEYTDSHFEQELTNEEIQLIATYMKCEWLDRTILTWENVKPSYGERDFSKANELDALRELANRTDKKAKQLEGIYHRSLKGKPFDYSKLAGG